MDAYDKEDGADGRRTGDGGRTAWWCGGGRGRSGRGRQGRTHPQCRTSIEFARKQFAGHVVGNVLKEANALKEFAKNS